jgi:hypothetical protein
LIFVEKLSDYGQKSGFFSKIIMKETASCQYGGASSEIKQYQNAAQALVQIQLNKI